MTNIDFPMRRVYGVSFPRSGHNLAYKLYEEYFGEAHVFCDPYGPEGPDCGCSQIPCVNPANTFSKNHDFEVSKQDDCPILEKSVYLVQLRNPVRSITSNFWLHCRNQGINPTRFNFRARREWRWYSRAQIRYWQRLVQKWAINPLPASSSRFLCSYQDFLEQPLPMARRLVELASIGPVDEARLEAVVRKVNPSPQKSINSFPYASKRLFAKIEEKVAKEMQALGLNTWQESY